MCVGHMMHMKHMKFGKGFFERTAGANAFQRMGYELLPPPAGRSPSLDEGGLGASPVKAFGLDRRLHIGALRSPLSPFARPLEGLL